MNILLSPNPDRDKGLHCTKATAQKLLELGAKPMLDHSFRELAQSIGDCVCGDYRELLRSCDVLMPVGGDGTIMNVVHDAVAAGKPILAVNAGRVGFMTQLEMDELDSLRILLDGRYSVQRRMMLEAELEDGSCVSALNDVVVSRGDTDCIVDLHVHQGELLIARHRADGIIFATPSGSTAYSLSAGGPIVDPGMRMIIMTAICSHSTFNRSLILPSVRSDYTVTEQTAHNTKGVTVLADGRRLGVIHTGQSVKVRGSRDGVVFIDLGLRDFYSRVNEKLSWGR